MARPSESIRPPKKNNKGREGESSDLMRTLKDTGKGQEPARERSKKIAQAAMHGYSRFGVFFFRVFSCAGQQDREW